MAKSSRAYKSSKRTKELLRQKKQEEKRQRRLARAANPHQGDDGELQPDAETPEAEGGETLEPGDETPEPGDETPPESA